MPEPIVQLDPLNSPHPVPWNWVMATLRNRSTQVIEPFYYRSETLLSPDRRYAAYSRLQMQVHPEFYRSHVTSVLFVENLCTGDLQAITPQAPLAHNAFLDEGSVLDGRISMVIPISWSEASDRLLAREFESVFCSDIASDYAVIVAPQDNQVHTVAPQRVEYTNAILLGWSQRSPDRVLFQAGMMGEEPWPLWSVDTTGGTIAAVADYPTTYGQVSNTIWTGPQAQAS